MAVKKNDVKVVNVMDVFWDGWFNSFKTFHSLQNGVEEQSLQVLETQKEWIKSTGEQLSRFEEDTKKMTTDWLGNLQNTLNKAQSEFGGQNILEWTDRLEEFGFKTDTSDFSPSKAFTDMLSKSHSHLEETLKSAFDQQQKNRSEILKALEVYVDQLKQSQNGVLKTFELYNPLVTK